MTAGERRDEREAAQARLIDAHGRLVRAKALVVVLGGCSAFAFTLATIFLILHSALAS
jgi:hypothetical protein